MQTEIIISGFGGQGALFAGQLLSYTALDNKLNTTWFPSYGPEMRGGTAHCIVIISDDEIGSPVVRSPKAAIVLNLPSLERYEPLVKPGGLLVVNESLVDRKPQREGIESVVVPATEEATALGSSRMANMILLGAMLQRLPIFSIEQVSEALGRHIPERRRNLLEANWKALRRGVELASEAAQ
jgi:2-oxoglutarate ferredoxin oxidoreductase subunit gamma